MDGRGAAQAAAVMSCERVWHQLNGLMELLAPRLQPDSRGVAGSKARMWVKENKVLPAAQLPPRKSMNAAVHLQEPTGLEPLVIWQLLWLLCGMRHFPCR